MNILLGNLWPLAMFFMCELETLKTHSNQFEKCDQSEVDFMQFRGKCNMVDSPRTGVLGLTLL